MIKKLAIIPLMLSMNNAFAGAATGGATEWTQIANNVELIQGVAESARQTTVQMNQLYTALQNVQGMGGLSAIEQKMGLPSGSLSKAAEMSGSVKNLRFTINGISTDSNNLNDKAKILTAAYKAAMKTYEKTGVPPSELLKQGQELKGEEAENYQKRIDYYKKQSDGMVDDIDRINKQSQGISSITGNVKGLQFLASQNVGINRTLKETSLALNQSMQQDALDKKAQAKSELEAMKQKQIVTEAAYKRYRNVTAVGPKAWKEAMGENND